MQHMYKCFELPSFLYSFHKSALKDLSVLNIYIYLNRHILDAFFVVGSVYFPMSHHVHWMVG